MEKSTESTVWTADQSHSEMGMELRPVMDALRVWGEKHIPGILATPFAQNGQ